MCACVYLSNTTSYSLTPTTSRPWPPSPLLELGTISPYNVPLPLRDGESFRKSVGKHRNEEKELLYISTPTASRFPQGEAEIGFNEGGMNKPCGCLYLVTSLFHRTAAAALSEHFFFFSAHSALTVPSPACLIVFLNPLFCNSIPSPSVRLHVSLPSPTGLLL